MENHIVKIISVEPVTHDVMRFTIQKPEGFKFAPGQATEVSINTPALENEKRPFTFTSLNDNKHLEFVIKIYDSHNGVTKELGKLTSVMFGAQLNIKAKECSLREVQVLPRSLLFLDNYKLTVKLQIIN